MSLLLSSNKIEATEACGWGKTKGVEHNLTIVLPLKSNKLNPQAAFYERKARKSRVLIRIELSQF